MDRRSLFGLLALVAALALAVGGLLLLRRPDTVTFVATGDSQGFLVPCGCKTTPSGGLARRAALLDSFRKDPQLGRVIPVELGQGFADRGPGRDLLNAAMGEFFDRQGYLVGLNSLDRLSRGQDLRRFVRRAPLLAAGELGFEGWRDFQLGGWGIGPVGVKGAVLRAVFLSQTAPGGAPLRDPLEVFREVRAAGEVDGYLLFGNLSPETVSALVKEEPRLVGVVSWWQHFVTPTPQRARDAWLLFNGDRGRRFASLRVVRSGGRWESFPQSGYLDPETPSSPEVQREAERVLDAVDRVNRAALESGKVPLGGGRPWAGPASCKGCHPKAWEIWSASRHARATQDLAVDHQERNPACLQCHATGVGRPGGFPQSPPDLGGVGCEACHGPGGGHPPAPTAPAAPPREACGSCHGLRDSPGFDAESYGSLIRHGR